MSADNHNLGIWNAVAKTDPSHTKAVTFGRKFTSIDAHWQIMRATEQFGPVGQGWGYNVDHSVERLTPEMILAVADVAIWWRDGDDKQMYGPVRGTCEMYGPKTAQGKPIPGMFITDEDAPKKAMTDALTKGLSHLGFSADVFLGLFDDNRYVQKVKKEFEQTSTPSSPDVRPEKRGGSDWVEESRRDGTLDESRQKGTLPAPKGATPAATGQTKDEQRAAKLKAATDKRISALKSVTGWTRATLDQFWSENDEWIGWMSNPDNRALAEYERFSTAFADAEVNMREEAA